MMMGGGRNHPCLLFSLLLVLLLARAAAAGGAKQCGASDAEPKYNYTDVFSPERDQGIAFSSELYIFRCSDGCARARARQSKIAAALTTPAPNSPP